MSGSTVIGERRCCQLHGCIRTLRHMAGKERRNTFGYSGLDLAGVSPSMVVHQPRCSPVLFEG